MQVGLIRISVLILVTITATLVFFFNVVSSSLRLCSIKRKLISVISVPFRLAFGYRSVTVLLPIGCP